MSDIVLHNVTKPIIVSHDRGGCRVTVHTSMLPSDIKRMLYEAADEDKNIYVPSEITQEANAYSFYIRQRQSVKGYLISHECLISDFAKLVKSVSDIISLAYKLSICVYDFIFDYSCIYTGLSLATIEFVYAPGSNMDKQFNSIADMLTIASLHIHCDDKLKEANILKEVTNILVSWEREENAPFPVDDILLLLNVEQENEKILFTNWKPFLYFQFAMLVVFVFVLPLIPFKENGVFVWIACLLLMVSIDYLLIPGKKLNKIRFLNKKHTIAKGYGFLKGQVYYLNKESISIGRDSKWADIVVPNIIVSRKHAEISMKDKKIYIKDLNSRNGTYINSILIKQDEDVILTKGSIITIGNSENMIKIMKT